MAYELVFREYGLIHLTVKEASIIPGDGIKNERGCQRVKWCIEYKGDHQLQTIDFLYQ